MKHIVIFDKAKGKDIVCPSFMELKFGRGCRFNPGCSWCYLNGTYRFMPKGKAPHIYPKAEVEKDIEKFFKTQKKPALLNTGELADSLMSESTSKPFTKWAVPLFGSQTKHKLLLLTKDTQIQHLLEMVPRLQDLDRQEQIIVSFSLNAHEVAEYWEKGAPPVAERIEAGKQLSEAGYEVRVRIDPIVPIEDWEYMYGFLIDGLMNAFTPSRITLGSLRGLQSTINCCKDKTWVEFLTEKSDWGKRIESTIRTWAYNFVIMMLREEHNYTGDIALCKEEPRIWSALGLDPKECKCNCVL